MESDEPKPDAFLHRGQVLSRATKSYRALYEIINATGTIAVIYIGPHRVDQTPGFRDETDIVEKEPHLEFGPAVGPSSSDD